MNPLPAGDKNKVEPRTRKRRPRITGDARRQLAAELARRHNEGMSIQRNALDHGLTWAFVRTLLLEHGVDLSTSPYRPAVGEQRLQLAMAVAEAYQAGESMAQLATRYRRTHKTIRALLRELSVEIRPKGIIQENQ